VVAVRREEVSLQWEESVKQVGSKQGVKECGSYGLRRVGRYADMDVRWFYDFVRE